MATSRSPFFLRTTPLGTILVLSGLSDWGRVALLYSRRRPWRSFSGGTKVSGCSSTTKDDGTRLRSGRFTREAELAAADVDRVLLRLEQGLLSLPPGMDVVAFVRNGGRVSVPQASPEPVSRPFGLQDLRERYLEVHSAGAMEESSLLTARIHLEHVTKSLGARFSLPTLSAADLQRHIDRRVATKSSRGRKISTTTVRKELATLRAAWNWAMTMGLVSSPFPGRGLVYPKTDEKPPFQTREEIERQISRGGLPAREKIALWDSLFLTLPEVATLLESVRTHATQPWVYPMVCAAAHTGARRSELLRGVWSRVVFGDSSGGGLLLDAVHEGGPLDDFPQQRRSVQRSPTL